MVASNGTGTEEGIVAPKPDGAWVDESAVASTGCGVGTGIDCGVVPPKLDGVGVGFEGLVASNGTRVGKGGDGGSVVETDGARVEEDCPKAGSYAISFFFPESESIGLRNEGVDRASSFKADGAGDNGVVGKVFSLVVGVCSCLMSSWSSSPDSDDTV